MIQWQLCRRGRGGERRRFRSTGLGESPEELVGWLIHENPVVIFSRPHCCMSQVMKRLLVAVGAHPASIELGEEADEEAAGGARLPALLVGGVAVSGLDVLMGLHLRDRLVPMLREVGALPF